MPTTGFFEWKREAGGRPVRPMFIRLRDPAPFAFAGLWERRETPRGLLHTFAIITTRPNAPMAEIHDRMPMILGRAAYDRWLDVGNTRPADLTDLLSPYPADEMIALQVGPAVNRVSHDSPARIGPVEGGLRLGLDR